MPIRHAVLEERTLARNPFLAESAAVATIIDPADGGRVYPISPPPVTYNRESTFYYNASSGATIYRGDQLGPGYEGDALFCEALMNIVQRRPLEHRGPTFFAGRAANEADREFIAATDRYFRPVNLATGPDGALYLVDMYREVVEHPEFVPKPLRDVTDFRRWSNRGRLWRVSRKGADLSMPPKLSKATAAELIALLEHPNGWRRDTAQRLLVTRRDITAAPALETMARASESPLGRIHAAWTLDGLGALPDPIVEALLEDPAADVRQCAAKLAVGRVELLEAVAALAEDDVDRVRFQAAITLGDHDAPEAVAALASIAAQDADDEWSRLAVLGGLRETAAPFLASLLEAHPEWLATPTPGQAHVLASTAAILGARAKDDELRALADRLAPAEEESDVGGRTALLLGLSDGLARAGRPPGELAKEEGFEGIAALLDRAVATVDAAAAKPDDRARSLTLLSRFRPDDAAARVPALLAATQPDAVRSAAAEALARIRTPDLADRVLEGWESIPTGARRAVISALVRSAPLAARLTTALEDDAVAPTELTPAEREALRNSSDPDVARRGRGPRAARTPANRAEVVAKLQPALDLTGDPERGRELFAQNCKTCHAHRGEGFQVGPDISGVASRPPSALLVDVLDPNADVSPDFIAFAVVTNDGQTFSGLLAEETATSLKLKAAEGVETSLLRSEVEAVRGTGRSLMPEGFEDVLGEQGMADLIAFLKLP
jgi:putative heme-binding domain-containing protein